MTREFKPVNEKRDPLPSLASDEAAEAFVAEADLTKYDLSGFKPMHFEIEPRSAAFDRSLPPAF